MSLPEDGTLTPDPEPLPPPAGDPRGPRGNRAVMLGLVVAVLAAVAGAGIAHVAWPGGSSTPSSASAPSNQRLHLLPSSPGAQSAAPSASSASTAAVSSRVAPGLVDINDTLGDGTQAAGTGMVVTSSGEVITNNHVILGATHITATDVGNGKTYTAHVVGYDRTADVAVLQLRGASGLKTVALGNSSSVRLGQSVVTIGNAGGIGGTPTSAPGSVTALGRSITAGNEVDSTFEQLAGLIQIDGQLQPGDSGGPLVDRSGRVVGMDTAASSTFSFQTSSGQGFAIPVNTVVSLANKILAGKTTDTIHVGTTPLMGVDIQTAGFGGDGSQNAPGVFVSGVVPGSPADAIGIAQGDSITALGGHTVNSPADLVAVKDRYHPGDHVQITWSDQAGASHTATITMTSGAPD